MQNLSVRRILQAQSIGRSSDSFGVPLPPRSLEPTDDKSDHGTDHETRYRPKANATNNKHFDQAVQRAVKQTSELPRNAPQPLPPRPHKSLVLQAFATVRELMQELRVGDEGLEPHADSSGNSLISASGAAESSAVAAPDETELIEAWAQLPDEIRDAICRLAELAAPKRQHTDPWSLPVPSAIDPLRAEADSTTFFRGFSMSLNTASDGELALGYMHKHDFPIDLESWVELVWEGSPPPRDEAFWAMVPEELRPLPTETGTGVRNVAFPQPESTPRRPMIVSFGKHRGATVETLVLDEPGYVVWMSSQSDTTADFDRFVREAQRLIQVFERKPFTARCEWCACTDVATCCVLTPNRTVLMCDDCQRFSDLSEAQVIRTYSNAVGFAYKQDHLLKVLIRRLAEAKGAQVPFDSRNAVEFFGR